MGAEVRSMSQETCFGMTMYLGLSCHPRAANWIVSLPGEEEDIESWLKKSQMWAGGSDSLGVPNFHGLGMDSSTPRMRPPQQRLESAVPSPQNEFYRALAAEALQEIRTRDSSKQFHPQSLLSSQQLHFQSQQQDQQSMHQMVDASGPLLQLSFSGPQPQVDLVCSMRPENSYCESELQMVPSSFSLLGLLGRTAQTNSPTRENSHFFNILRPNQSEMQTSIQGTDLIVQDPQVLNLLLLASQWIIWSASLLCLISYLNGN